MSLHRRCAAGRSSLAIPSAASLATSGASALENTRSNCMPENEPSWPLTVFRTDVNWISPLPISGTARTRTVHAAGSAPVSNAKLLAHHLWSVLDSTTLNPARASAVENKSRIGFWCASSDPTGDSTATRTKGQLKLDVIGRSSPVINRSKRLSPSPVASLWRSSLVVVDGLRLTMQSINASSWTGEGSENDWLAQSAQYRSTVGSTDVVELVRLIEQATTVIPKHSERTIACSGWYLCPLFASFVMIFPTSRHNCDGKTADWLLCRVK